MTPPRYKPRVPCLYASCTRPGAWVVYRGPDGVERAKCDFHYDYDRKHPWGSVARVYGHDD